MRNILKFAWDNLANIMGWSFLVAIFFVPMPAGVLFLAMAMYFFVMQELRDVKRQLIDVLKNVNNGGK